MSGYKTDLWNIMHDFTVFNYIPKEKEEIARQLLRARHVVYTMTPWKNGEIQIAVREERERELNQIVKFVIRF